MNPTEIAGAVGAGAVAAIVAVTLVVQAWAKLVAKIAELKAIAKKAAASAQAVDQSLHATNSGKHVKDYMNRSEEQFARMVDELRAVKQLAEDTNRDVQTLHHAQVEQVASASGDREATRRELSEIRASVSKIEGGLQTHIAEVPTLVEQAKREAIRELGMAPSPPATPTD